MKIKHKGKVHPSPSSSSDVLQLLPAAILTLASVLSLDDREVLAYLITRSMASSITPHPSTTNNSKPSSKKSKNKHKPFPHTPPLFHCDCFDCYTSYWFRWDSSPNRHLIHHVIDAFEDHLTHGENATRKSGHRGKKKERTTSRTTSLPIHPPPLDFTVEVNSGVAESQDNEAPPSISPDNADVDENMEAEMDMAAPAEMAAEEEAAAAALALVPASSHRGLARMVLPDVMGLLNSRLWNLWGPNV